MIGQINTVLCYFANIDCLNRPRLLQIYCSSFYGCELWDLWHCGLDQFCSSWRKGVRRAWRLPCNTHNDLLPALCGSRAIRDELCCRSLSFISTCLHSDNVIVNTVARYGVEFGRMFTPVCRNTAFCNKKKIMSIL